MSAQKTTYGTLSVDFGQEMVFLPDYENQRELTNHLGNVLAVVSDRKIAVEDLGNPGTVEYYEADIVSAQDYYPFGMIQPGRSVSAGEYRYGFGGQEMDNEISGTGNSYTAEYWQYDSRLGRRWNVDPVRVTWESPYATFRNNPIVFNDPDGDCPDCPDEADNMDMHQDDAGTNWMFSSESGDWEYLKTEYVVDGRYGPIQSVSEGTNDPSNYGDKLDLSLTLIGSGLDLADAGILGTIFSLGALTKDEVTPGDAVPLPIDMMSPDYDELDYSTDQIMASQHWGLMVDFAKRYNQGGQTSVLFVYSAQDVHEGTFSGGTPHVYPTPEAAQKDLGFKPSVVYFRFTSPGSEPPGKLKMKD